MKRRGTSSTIERQVPVRVKHVTLAGTLRIPRKTWGAVLLAHASGASRPSRSMRDMAGVLEGAGLATVLLDLLKPREVGHRERALDVHGIGMLAARIRAATARVDEALGGAPLGYLAVGPAAAAALRAAAGHPRIRAVVVYGLPSAPAGDDALASLAVPTLFIAPRPDPGTMAQLRHILASLPAPTRLEVVPDNGEWIDRLSGPARVAHLACDWFKTYLGDVGAATSFP